MNVRRTTVGLVATVGIVSLLAGCSDATGTGEAGSSGFDGSLTVGVSTVPEVLDPGKAFLADNIAILGVASGTLTTLDEDAKGTSNGLAASIEETDTAFTITLLPDLKFSDDTDLTSADVVASFEHYLGDATNAFAYKFAPIDSVTAVDDLTVEFNLNKPYASLPWILATPQAAIIPSEVIEERGESLYDTPVPTAGKFEIESLNQNEITLKANPNYAGPALETKSIVFKGIADSAARLAQVQGGELDFAAGISPKVLAQLAEPIEARTTIGVNGITLMALNNRESSILSDVNIRQAVARAIDREQINQIIWSGMNEPALALFSPDSQYSRPFLPATAEIDSAEEYLAGTACEGGCELELIVDSGDEGSNDMALIVQQNLREVGITVNISKAESGAMIQRSSDGDFDLLLSFTYENGDFPDSLLPFQLGPAIEAFYTGYSSAEMDALLEKVSVTTGEARTEAVDQVNTLFETDLPFVPIAANLSSSASRVPADIFSVTPSFAYLVG